MKHIKLFEDFKLNEIVGKQSQYYGYDEKKTSEGMKKLWAAILSLVQESPITFNVSKSEDYMQVEGPFNTYMRFGYDKKNNLYYVEGNKFKVSNDDPEKTFREAKKSMELKYFLKGEKVEKLKADRLKKVIKDASKSDGFSPIKVIMDFLYYSEPIRRADKEDRSGPWSTSGTSVDTYVYDLKPLCDGLDIDIESVKEVIMKNEEQIVKKLGHYANGMMSKKTEKFAVSDYKLTITIETHIYYN